MKDNECVLLEMKNGVEEEEHSTTTAKGFAESISIASSTLHVAPELVMEDDEMDEDGDEDDDLDIWIVCSNKDDHYSFALGVDDTSKLDNKKHFYYKEGRTGDCSAFL